MADSSGTLPPARKAIDERSIRENESILSASELCEQAANHAVTTGLRRSILRAKDFLVIQENWSYSRKLLGQILVSHWFLWFMGFLILSWTILSVVETDLQAKGTSIPEWLHAVENICLVIFVLELVARFYVLHLGFFYHMYNVVDLVVVSIDISVRVVSVAVSNAEFMPSASVLRLFRLVQFVRVSKFMMHHRKLYIMMEGLASAVKASLWAMILILLLLLVWSVAAVELMHPITKDIATEELLLEEADFIRFRRAFQSVWMSCLTLWEIVIMGGAWDTVAIPIIDHSPWAFFFFSGVVATVQLGLMNLVLTVIVDQATSAREADTKRQAAEKYETMVAAKAKLKAICEELDKDGNGNISFEELTRGAEESEDFADILQVMDIEDEDISILFQIMDTDKSGEIDYEEFTEQIFKMKTQQEQTVLAFIKHQLTIVRDDIKVELDMLKEDSSMLKEELQLFNGLTNSTSQLHLKMNEVLHEMRARRAGVAARNPLQEGNAWCALPASELSSALPMATSVAAGDNGSAHVSWVPEVVAQEVVAEEPMHELSRILEQMQQTFVTELGVSADHMFQQIQQSMQNLLQPPRFLEPAREGEAIPAKLQTRHGLSWNVHAAQNSSHRGLRSPTFAPPDPSRFPQAVRKDANDASNLLRQEKVGMSNSLPASL